MKKSYITGDKNLDMEIILNLKDIELEPVCNVNNYIKSICESDVFWMRRLLNKFEKSRIHSNSVFKLNLSPMTGKIINNMKDYFGFTTLKQLNDYLSKFDEKILYGIGGNYKSIGNAIGQFYDIDKKLLPQYINYDELIYEIKRNIGLGVFSVPKIGNNIEINHPQIANHVSGFKTKGTIGHAAKTITDFKKLGMM